MQSEKPFTIALAVLFTCFGAIRAHYRFSMSRPRALSSANLPHALLLAMLIPFEVITLALFFLRRMSWAALPLPPWVRWTGAPLGVAALILFVWVHRSLGSNFSSMPYAQDGQSLITSGPYRWVRHPMYTAFYLQHLSTFLLTANWFIGLTWLGGLTLVIALRLRKEEEVMIDRFGDRYLSYMRRTGRFLMPIRLNLSTLTGRSCPSSLRRTRRAQTPDDAG